MILSKGALTVALALTCVGLSIAGFMFVIWQIQLLTQTNQLIHLLGALVGALLTWVWIRCTITLLD